MIEPVTSDRAPAAIGPYSQAVVCDGFVFTSGQIPLDPATGALVGGGFGADVRRVLANLEAVLAAAGTDFRHVIKATVFLVDLGHYNEFNAIYAAAMGNHRPARSVVQVAALPRGSSIEIEMVAKRD